MITKEIPNKNTDKHRLVGVIALTPLIVAIIIGSFLRILGLFHYNIFDIGPSPDQVRDAFIYMDMGNGDFPGLGPTASGGKYGYSLPPLYYYLVFPFSLLGSHPSYQVIPNVLFSILTIILVAYLTYKLLVTISPRKRLFLSGIAALWYAVCFPEIFVSTFEWNPSPIPFFFISFILLCEYQISKFSQNNLRINLLSWMMIGFLLAILVSLHSATLFVMPAVFLIASLWFVIKYRKLKYTWSYPLLAVISSNIALLTYWKLEISRNFVNTKGILQTILGGNDKTGGLLASVFGKVKALLISFYELGDQAYFLGINPWLTLLSFLLLSLSLYFAWRTFKGNWNLFILLNITWLLFLLAAANYPGEYFFISYKLLILIAPLTYTVVALAYLNQNQRFEKIAIMALMLLLGISMISNLKYDLQYVNSKIGLEPVTSVNEVITTLDSIPNDSRVCYPRKQGSRQKINQYDYINQYLMDNRFMIVQDCSAGDYLLHPKRTFIFEFNNRWPLFEVEENMASQLKLPHEKIKETPSLFLIKFN